MKYVFKIIFILMITSAISQTPKSVNTSSVYETSSFGFSQAVQHQQLLFTSGQVGWDTSYQLPDSTDFGKQARVALRNIEKILIASQSDLQHVIQLRIYVVNLGIYEREVISKLLKTHYPEAYQPATTLLGITSLARPNLRIELEAIASIIKEKP